MVETHVSGLPTEAWDEAGCVPNVSDASALCTRMRAMRDTGRIPVGVRQDAFFAVNDITLDAKQMQEVDAGWLARDLRNRNRTIIASVRAIETDYEEDGVNIRTAAATMAKSAYRCPRSLTGCFKRYAEDSAAAAQSTAHTNERLKY